MIQPQELRIKNIVSIDGVMIEVRSITKDKIGYYHAKRFWYEYEFKDFDPVPLSEELLLKCGAINKFGRTYFIGKIKFDINTLNIVRFHYSGKVAYIDYLHQLQNLWHSLYNEELQINL